MNCEKIVHVMLATYNGEKYIDEQLNSLENQTYTNWILYIRDDGSTDGTLNKIDVFKRKLENKVVLIDYKTACRGAKENFSYLYNLVDKADYYMFCDQDDVWLPEKIEIMVNKMTNLEEHNSEKIPLIVYSDMKVVDENLGVIHDSFVEYSKLSWNGKYILQQVFLFNTIPGCAMMFNDILKQEVMRIPREAIMHDWWLVIICATFGKIEFINKSVSLYRQHPKNVVGVTKINWALKFLEIIKFYSIRKNGDRDINRDKINQLEAFLKEYNKYLNHSAKVILYNLLNMFYSKNTVKNIIKAYIGHYIVLNKAYTLKFWFYLHK